MTSAERHGGLADVLDDHLAAEFATCDLDATMATMTGDPYLNHVPVLTGGIGRAEVRRFYQQTFIGHWPAGTTMERISPHHRQRPGGRRTGVVVHPRHRDEPSASRRAPHWQAGTAGGVRGGWLPGRQAQP